MADTSMKTFMLLCVLCWYCVQGISETDIILNIPRRNDEVGTAVVNPGSNVRFVCIIPSSYRKLATLYMGSVTVASLTNENGYCTLYNINGRFFRRLRNHGCTNTNFSMVLSNVNAADKGNWFCSTPMNRTSRSPEISQTISLAVESFIDPSLGPSITNKYSTKRPSTSLQTVPLPTTTTISREVDLEQERDTSRPTPSDNMIPILGGAIGGAILFLAIIIAVIVSLRRRRNSQSGVSFNISDRTDDKERETKGDDSPSGTSNVQGSDQRHMQTGSATLTQIIEPGHDYSDLHSDPQHPPHVYTAISGGTMGEIATIGGNCRPLHPGVFDGGTQGQITPQGGVYYNCRSEAQDGVHEYTHRCSVIDGRPQGQITPQGGVYYNCPSDTQEDDHEYTYIDAGTCQTRTLSV